MAQDQGSGQPDGRQPVIDWYDSLDPCDEQPVAGIMGGDRKEWAEEKPNPPPARREAGGFSESRKAFGTLIGTLGREVRGLFRRRPRAKATQSPEPPQPPRPQRRPRRIRWLAGFGVALTIWIFAIGGVFAWALRDVPWQQILDGSLEPVVVLEDSSGQLLVQEGPFRGAYASFDQFPQHLVDAVLSVEDRRFFEHRGVDLRGMARALMRNLSAGQVMEGGSTITQQLVKVLYLESDRTYRRKLQEALVAFWLEARLDKEEILARYLNNVYLGAGATGVPAAARAYFDKNVEELDLSESAMIVALIRSPSMLNPFNNPEGARQRASLVLDAMVANGALESEEADAARMETAMLNPSGPIGHSGSWFADWAMQEAREILTRMPDIEPAGDVEWLRSTFISGPRHMPVRFSPGPRLLEARI
jgi:penicillin-binding protein 1A